MKDEDDLKDRRKAIANNVLDAMNKIVPKPDIDEIINSLGIALMAAFKVSFRELKANAQESLDMWNLFSEHMVRMFKVSGAFDERL